MNKLKEITDSAKQWIKHNPKQSLWIAIFVAGFLIGAILF
jgi:ElaB/YqjD/DUF883 family membrane-anchored ribosome-binding protein